jgi:hypothetical protein
MIPTFRVPEFLYVFHSIVIQVHFLHNDAGSSTLT